MTLLIPFLLRFLQGCLIFGIPSEVFFHGKGHFPFRYSPFQVLRSSWAQLLGRIMGRISLYEDSHSDTSHPIDLVASEFSIDLGLGLGQSTTIEVASSLDRGGIRSIVWLTHSTWVLIPYFSFIMGHVS